MAPGHGFEPRLDDPESPVLPLDDPGTTINILYHPRKFGQLYNIRKTKSK